MDKAQKFDLVFTAILEARKKSRDPSHVTLELLPPDRPKVPDDLSALEIREWLRAQPKIVPSITADGKLQGLSRLEALKILEEFEREHEVIKLPRFNYPPNRHDQKTAPSDDFLREKIGVSILAGFDNWYDAYLLRKQDDLSKQSDLNVAKFYNTVLDIDDQLQLNASTEVEISPRFESYRHSLGSKFDDLRFREEALIYLKRVGAIDDFDPPHLHPLLFSDLKPVIRVSLNIKRFSEVKQRIIEEYEARKNEPSTASTGRPKNVSHTTNPPHQAAIAVETPPTITPFVTYPLPHGCTFKQVKVELASDESIRIRLPGKTPKVFTYAELGFKDKRRGDMPNVLWEVLCAFAENNGVIDWNSNVPVEWRKQLPKHIQRLRQHLQSIFQTDQDPIEYDPDSKGYSCQFEIKDTSRGGVGRRAAADTSNEISI